jgi:hypothetical protein
MECVDCPDKLDKLFLLQLSKPVIEFKRFDPNEPFGIGAIPAVLSYPDIEICGFANDGIVTRRLITSYL